MIFKGMDIPLLKEIVKANDRIKARIRKTPLEFSPYLSRLTQKKVYLKLENIQITGSFKLRGAFNKLLSLCERDKKKGVITASTGNHGAAFAYAAETLNIKGIICMPENASLTKIEAMEQYGADIRFHGDDCLKAEIFAKQLAFETGRTYISPYNDVQIIAGHGTIGIELELQKNKLDAVFVPVGGGGLISGIAGYLKKRDPQIKIIGCQPFNSAVMYESLKAGKILDMDSKPTLSDGTAGGIEENSMTFLLCKEYIDEFILLSEEEIKNAVRLILEKHHLLIEGAAALSVAAFLKSTQKAKNVALILSGSKLSIKDLKKILECC